MLPEQKSQQTNERNDPMLATIFHMSERTHVPRRPWWIRLFQKCAGEPTSSFRASTSPASCSLSVDTEPRLLLRLVISWSAIELKLNISQDWVACRPTSSLPSISLCIASLTSAICSSSPASLWMNIMQTLLQLPNVHTCPSAAPSVHSCPVLLLFLLCPIHFFTFILSP